MVVFCLKKFLKGFIPSKAIIWITLLSFSVGISVTYLFPGSVLNLPVVKWFFSEYETLSDPFLFIFTVFSGNAMVNLLVIISGIALILPSIVLFMNFTLFGAVASAGIYQYGLTKTLILILGLLYIYPEFLALMLAADCGMRIAKKSLLIYKEEGHDLLFRSNLNLEIKETIVNEFLNAFPRIILLIAIAAILEAFWAPFWHNCISII